MNISYSDGTLTMTAGSAEETKQLEKYAAEIGVTGAAAPSESATMFTAPRGALILVPSGCFDRRP